MVSPLFMWKGRCNVSPFYWRLERNYWGLRKNKREREMENQSAGLGFFNINPLYWEKIEKKKKKINLLKLLCMFCQVSPGFCLFGQIGRSHVRAVRRRDPLFQTLTAQQSCFFSEWYIFWFSLIFFWWILFLLLGENNLSYHPLCLFNFQCGCVTLLLVEKVIDFHQRNHAKDE